MNFNGNDNPFGPSGGGNGLEGGSNFGGPPESGNEWQADSYEDEPVYFDAFSLPITKKDTNNFLSIGLHFYEKISDRD